MFGQTTLEHHVQKHIMNVLTYIKFARFRDLRPPNIETNLYSYHLRKLQKSGWVIKTEKGYTLSSKGLIYVDRISSKKLNLRVQSKIITMLFIQNSRGDVLLYKRPKQPYIDTWTLPYGKTHIEDKSLLNGARRESLEKLGVQIYHLEHAGDCYIRALSNDEVQSSTLAHVFSASSDEISETDILKWVAPSDLSSLDLAPAVKDIVERLLSSGKYFMEEYVVDYAS